MKSAPAPPFEEMATAASGTCMGLARSAYLLDGPNDPLEKLGGVSGMPEGHEAAVGGDRQRPPRGDVTVRDERSALAVPAEPEGLQLADDLEGEGIVELGHVHVGRLEAGHRKGAPGGTPADEAVGEVRVVAAAHVPARERCGTTAPSSPRHHRGSRPGSTPGPARGRPGPGPGRRRLRRSSSSRGGDRDRRPCARRGCRLSYRGHARSRPLWG